MLTVQRWVPVFGMLMAAALLPPGAYARQQRAAAEPDAAALDALVKAKPGAYLVNGRTIAPSADASALPVFVQTDVYRRAEGGIEVTVAIGAQAPGAWAARLRIAKAGATGNEGRAAEATLSGLAGSVRQTSHFTLQPGNYELVLALVAGKGGSGGIGTVVRQGLTVPDLAAQTLASSPMVLGDAVSYVAGDAPSRPFVFGTTQLMPAARNQFRQSDQLHIACRVYGWKADADAKPDLTVEYVFQEHIHDHVRFFNKTKTQELNARTLARTFDGKAGAVAVGMTVPLGAFPTGEFDLVVRIKDKRTQTMTSQKATFVVRE
jgi:hypothetical protein